MKLRTRLILLVTLLLVLFMGGLLYYLNFYLKSQFKQTTMGDFKALAEISEGAYFAFTNTIKTRTIDWSSDGHIRETVEKVISLETAKKDKEKLINELNIYLKEKKIIYDPNVVIIDILDKDGIVIASSRNDRLGVNEKKEETERGALRFKEAIGANFGQAFVRSVVEEKDESSEPMIHSTARIFSTKEDTAGKPKPLEAVLFLHFANTKELGEVLTGQWQKKFEAETNQAFFERYQTADIYLVNQNYLMASPSRFSKEGVLKDKVETVPVKACFENGGEITKEYQGPQGKPVLGVSMCLKRDNLVLIVEVQSQEVFNPLGGLQRRMILVGVVVSILSSLGIFFFTRRPLKELEIIIDAAKKISGGNFTSRANVSSEDEIGHLAQVFNQMLDSLENYQSKLQQSNLGVVSQSKEVARRNESLENTEKAMLNILQDARGLEEALKIEKAGVEKKVVERTTQLKEEKVRLEASINSLNIGFIMTDIQANVLTMNGAAGRILCFTEDDIKFGGALNGPLNLKCDMKTIQKALDGSFPLTENIQTCLKAQKIIDIKEVNFRGRILHIFIAPIVKLEQSLQVIGTVVLIEDVTEAKMLDRSRDEFFSIASHELRTPLTAIRGNISLIQQIYADKIQEKDFKEMLADIYESSTRLIEIVNDFLDTSRLELGKIQFKNIEFDLTELIKTVVQEYVNAGSARNLYIKFAESKNPIPKVFADKDRVKQVLINLVSNSLKCTEKGGVTIEAATDGDSLKVRVSDTGRGISVDGQKLLFRKFQQTGESIYTRDTVKGTGLGLYISKLMVEAMGGEIKLERSEVGKGATFVFSLLTAGSAKALKLQSQDTSQAVTQAKLQRKPEVKQPTPKKEVV